MLPATAPAEPLSKCGCMRGVCASACMRRMSENACALSGPNMDPLKSNFYTEITHLSILLQSAPFRCERPENSNAS